MRRAVSPMWAVPALLIAVALCALLGVAAGPVGRGVRRVENGFDIDDAGTADEDAAVVHCPALVDRSRAPCDSRTRRDRRGRLERQPVDRWRCGITVDVDERVVYSARVDAPSARRGVE